MALVLNEYQENALLRLKQGIKHVDNYTPKPTDDEPIYLVPDAEESLYEFARDGGRVTLGDLRDLVSILGGYDDGK